MNKIIIEDIRDFDLRETFGCGQCFRWNEQEDGSYSGMAMGNIANMRLERSASGGEENAADSGLRLVIYGTGSEEFWREYLDLDRDYGKIKSDLTGGEPKYMPRAIEAGAGIRILRQELWETVVDFIISQNNNIPRIKGCVEKLAELAGEYAGELNGKKYYSIPSPERLAKMTREELAPVRLGYRDKYLIETAKRWVELSNERETDMSVEISRFSGVGPKVEACIRLFGLHDLKSFPIDVWVKRLMHRFYRFDENDRKGMEDFAKERFGEYAGLAQQYLFYYIRQIDAE